MRRIWFYISFRLSVCVSFHIEASIPLGRTPTVSHCPTLTTIMTVCVLLRLKKNEFGRVNIDTSVMESDIAIILTSWQVQYKPDLTLNVVCCRSCGWKQKILVIGEGCSFSVSPEQFLWISFNDTVIKICRFSKYCSLFIALGLSHPEHREERGRKNKRNRSLLLSQT